MDVRKKEQIQGALAKHRGEVAYNTIELREIEGVGLEAVKTKEGTLPATKWALRQLLKELDIPVKFYKELNEGLQTDILKFRIGEQSADDKEVVFRMANDQLTAVLHPDYAQVRVENLLDQLPDWDFFESVDNPHEPWLHYRAMDRTQPIVDDVYHGFDFLVSEMGAAPLTIQAMTVKVICENGAVRLRPTGNPYFELAMTKLAGPEYDAVAAAAGDRILQEHEEVVAALERKKAEQVSTREVIEMWVQSGIPKTIPRRLNAWLEQINAPGTMSVFDLAQHLTRSAKGISYRRRRHFEKLAGKMLGLTINVVAE